MVLWIFDILLFRTALHFCSLDQFFLNYNFLGNELIFQVKLVTVTFDLAFCDQ